MISQVSVTNKEKFESYLANTQSVSAKYGSRSVAIGTHANGRQTLLFSFQLQNGIRRIWTSLSRWIDPPCRYGEAAKFRRTYQPLTTLHNAGADMRMTSYEVTYEGGPQQHHVTTAPSPWASFIGYFLEKLRSLYRHE